MTPVEIMVEFVQDLKEKNIWTGTPMEVFRGLGMTNRGEAGERFVKRYLNDFGIRVENGRRTDLVDWKIEGSPCEVKTASLGRNGTFQFNHIRLDRAYDILILIGVCPNDIVCGFWEKSDVAEGNAGRLVQMTQDQDITFKLIIRLDNMRPINELPEVVKNIRE